MVVVGWREYLLFLYWIRRNVSSFFPAFYSPPSHLLFFAYFFFLCHCTFVFHSFILLLLIFCLLFVAVVLPISVSHGYTSVDSNSRCAVRHLRRFALLVVRYMDGSCDRHDARQLAAVRLLGMCRLFVMSCMERSLIQLWMLRRNVGDTWTVGMCQN